MCEYSHRKVIFIVCLKTSLFPSDFFYNKIRFVSNCMMHEHLDKSKYQQYAAWFHFMWQINIWCTLQFDIFVSFYMYYFTCVHCSFQNQEKCFGFMCCMPCILSGKNVYSFISSHNRKQNSLLELYLSICKHTHIKLYSSFCS